MKYSTSVHARRQCFADIDHVRKALNLFIDPSQNFEIRTILEGGGHPCVCASIDEGIEAVRDASDPKAVFWILNPVEPGCSSASKKTVLSRRWLLVDVDPVRPADVSATEAEKAAAALVAASVQEHLSSLGWPAPVMTDSGNGWHLLYRVDLPHDPPTQQIVKKLLAKIADQFDTDAAHIDRSTHDAPRPCKLPGTWARKGPDTRERPHRMARIVFEPESIKILPVEKLREFIGEAEEPKSDSQNGEASNNGHGKLRWSTSGGRSENGKNYVMRAIESEIVKVTLADQGNRNNALNEASFALGTMAGWPEMDGPATRAMLVRAGERAGLTTEECEKTVASGWEAGSRDPRDRPEVQRRKRLAELETAGDLENEPILAKDGKWVPCLKNSELWLARRNVAAEVRFDTFRQTILVGKEIISDELVIAITSKIETETRVRWYESHVRAALVNTAASHRFSSLLEWLSLQIWDGIPRVDDFFVRAYGVRSSLYARECAKVLFLSAAARAYKPGCQADVTIVLISPQGEGKSMGVAALAPFPEWYADDLGCDLFDGKAGEGLQGKWLFEFSEFARVNRATMDAVKSFLSRRVDHYRPPYGRISQDFPRSCIFIGTTNDQHPLRDHSNRRFMPIHCGTGDVEWIRQNRNQLWAEAVKRYNDGEAWWVNDPNLATECVSAQEEARQDDAWEAILAEKLVRQDRILIQEAAEMLGVKHDRLDKATQMRVSSCLQAIGFVRRREGTRDRSWYYARKVTSHAQTAF